ARSTSWTAATIPLPSRTSTHSGPWSREQPCSGVAPRPKRRSEHAGAEARAAPPERRDGGTCPSTVASCLGASASARGGSGRRSDFAHLPAHGQACSLAPFEPAEPPILT